MKKPTKPISLILALLLLMSVLAAAPFTADAAIVNYALWLGTTQVTSENCDDIFGDGKAFYDDSTHVLTLKNPTITGRAQDDDVSTAKIFTKISDLTIRGSYHMTGYDGTYGIEASGSLSLEGNFIFYGSDMGVYVVKNFSLNKGSLTAYARRGEAVGAISGMFYIKSAAAYFEAHSENYRAIYYKSEDDFWLSNDWEIIRPYHYFKQGEHCLLDEVGREAKDIIFENVDNMPQTGETGDCIWRFDPSTGEMTISGEGAMADYEWNDKEGFSDAPWKDFYEEITDVVIEDGVTNVGDLAFSGCSQLSTLSLGKDVKEIGVDSFAFCPLKKLTFPDSVESIGPWAFYNDRYLTEVTFGKGLRYIYGYAFKYCNLSAVTFPDSIEWVGDFAFFDNKNMRSVTVGKGIQTIYDRAVGYIEDDDTFEVSPIEGFTICGRADTAAETYAKENGFTFVAYSGEEYHDFTWDFDPTTGVLTIGGNGSITEYDLYFLDQRPWHPYRGQIKRLVIGDEVFSVGTWAFYGCTNLTEVTLGKGLLHIGECAFMDTALTYVEIPDKVQTIAELAFYGVPTLTYVKLGKNMTTILDYAFENTGLIAVSIPANVQNISKYAFGYYTDNDPVEGFTIWGYAGTAAERYAKNNGFVFVPIEDEATLGDVDENGKIDINDATEIQKFLAELVTLTPEQQTAADVNCDSKVDISDATLIQKYAAELIDYFVK